MPISSRWSSYGDEDNQTYLRAWDEADPLPDFNIIVLLSGHCQKQLAINPIEVAQFNHNARKSDQS